MKKYLLLSTFALTVLFANATIYTVTSNVDGTTTDGVSLRWAITQANGGATGDTIQFNIPGMAPHTIAINTALPNISDNAIFINGLSQPPNGYTGPEPRIILKNNAAVADGLYFFANQNARIDGMWIRDFTSDGIYLFGSVVFLDVYKCKLSNNGAYGFYLVGSSANSYVHESTVCNNTSDGIYIFGAGAYSTIENNLVSGNGGRGIVINGGSDTCYIRGNRVGTDSSGTMPFPNTGTGIETNNNGNRIGGMNPGEGNIVAYNGGDGIHVSIGDYNLISRNSLFCNTGLGINLTTGANNNFASPVILSAAATGVNGTATANSRIEVFYDTACTGCEGKNYIGTTYASATGAWYLATPLTVGSSVTATAADTANDNTSRFAACVTVMTTTVQENNSENAQIVYPNPFSANFQVKGVEPGCEIKLMNTLGETLGKWTVSSEDFLIELPAMASGVYLIEVKNSTGTHTTKLVKE